MHDAPGQCEKRNGRSPADKALGPGAERLSRIVLICGCIEPERDGVGDYTIGMGRALSAQGVDVKLLSMADRGVKTPLSADGVLRLPASLSATERYSLAAQALADWSPDWNSLQFSSWDYGKWGVVGAEGPRLRRLLSGRPLHMMFHEPWMTGRFEMPSSRRKLLQLLAIGQMQKYSIALLARLLRPALVHTSNAVYQDILSDIGITAEQLPLFGNIDFSPPSSWETFRTLVGRTAGLDLGADREKVLLAGLFGTLRRAPIEPALQALLAASAGRRTVLLSLGCAGPSGPEQLARWRQAAQGIETGAIGKLDSASLSSCFQHLDVAISLHPSAVVGRSGAAAALLEHGLYLLSPWGAPPPPGDAFATTWREQLLAVDANLAGLLRNPPKRSPRPDMAARSAAQLLSAIRARRRDQVGIAKPVLT